MYNVWYTVSVCIHVLYMHRLACISHINQLHPNSLRSKVQIETHIIWSPHVVNIKQYIHSYKQIKWPL